VQFYEVRAVLQKKAKPWCRGEEALNMSVAVLHQRRAWLLRRRAIKALRLKSSRGNKEISRSSNIGTHSL
jgi:hypothetical protein